jgi:alpha-beta hydrolase superfamily lysophospholipase
MSRATRFKIYRVLVIASIILIVPLLFIVGVTLPYLFNTIKVSFPEIAIGKDVERYITEKELDFKNTDAKAKKKIIWNDDTKIKTEYSIVYLHGSFATGYQQEDVLVKVAEKLKANLFISRLAGHGSGFESTKNVKAENFLEDAAEAISVGNKIGEKVILMGFSAGGSFALMAAKDMKMLEKVSHLVLIAPWTPKLSLPYFIAATGLFFKSNYKFNFPGYFSLPNKEWDPFWVNEFHRTLPKQLWKAAYSGRNLEFPNTNLPLLVFYEEKDKVVKAEGVKKIFKEWKGPKKIINNNTNLGGFNYHDIIGILNSPQDELFVEEINNWIRANP